MKKTKAYEPDSTADLSFSVNCGNLATKTVYLIQNSVLHHDNKNIETDLHRFASSLQGLINRDFNGEDRSTVLFLLANDNEKYWLDYVQAEGKFLCGYETVKIHTLDEYLTTLDAQIRCCGIVLWDPAAPSTANLAATICGADGYLPVKYDTQNGSLYNLLMERFGQKIVKLSLVDVFTNPKQGAEKTFAGFSYTSSGSVKCDPYLWALEAYMDRCSSRFIAYTVDGAGSVDGNSICRHATPDFDTQSVDSHDYFIARHCFFFDLAPNGGEIPSDDPTQPLGTDLDTMKKILQARYDRAKGEFGQNFGFPPWTLKYTASSKTPQGEMDAVWVEWQFVEWCSAYNLAVEADAPSPANLFNASIYYKYIPTVSKYESNRPTQKLTFDPDTHYYTFYIGDYDSAIWMKHYIERFWMKDNARGKLPLAWAYNPNLSDRLPMLFDYVYQNKTDNDYFIAGDSGAGYVVPQMLLESSEKRTNPDGRDAYIRYAAPYYRRFDMDITGFILNTNFQVTNETREIFNKLSPVGSFDGPFQSADGPLVIYNSIPYLFLHCGVANHDDPIPEIFSAMVNYRKQDCSFMTVRFVVEEPDYLKNVVSSFEKYAADRGQKVQFVDPYTLFDLIHQSGQGTVINP